MFWNLNSGDSWMYPHQRTPIWNPYRSPISRGYLWNIIPKNPKVEHNKYHGAHTVRGTPNCPIPWETSEPRKNPALLSIESWLVKNGILNSWFFTIPTYNWVGFHPLYNPSLPNTLWVGFWTHKHLLRRPLGGPNTYSQGIWWILED